MTEFFISVSAARPLTRKADFPSRQESSSRRSLFLGAGIAPHHLTDSPSPHPITILSVLRTARFSKLLGLFLPYPSSALWLLKDPTVDARARRRERRSFWIEAAHRS